MSLPNPGKDRPLLRAVPDSPPQAESVSAVPLQDLPVSPQGWGAEATASLLQQAAHNTANGSSPPKAEKRRFHLPRLPKGWLKRNRSQLVTTFEDDVSGKFEALSQSNSSNEVFERAQFEAGVARTVYAEALAKRYTNTVFNSGKEINHGRKRSRLTKGNKSLQDNVQYRYEVALAVLRKAAAHKAEQDFGDVNSDIEKQALEMAKKVAVLEVMVGKKDSKDASEGEYFKLINDLEARRKVKSGFYELKNGRAVEKEGKFRKARLSFYRKWNQWFEGEDSRSRISKVAVLGLGTMVVGLTAGAAGAGLGVAAAAGIGSRYAKTWGVTRLRRQTRILNAEEDSAELREHIENHKYMAYGSLSQTGSTNMLHPFHAAQILNGAFRDNANEQARHNRRHLAVAVGSSALAGVLVASGAKELVSNPFTEKSLPTLAPEEPESKVPKSSAPEQGLAIPTNPPPLEATPPGVTDINPAPENTSPPPPKNELPPIKGRYVSEIYTDEFGQNKGFTKMVSAAERAIDRGYLVRVQPNPANPDHFWYQVTAKGAEVFDDEDEDIDTGSTKTRDVLKVLRFRRAA